MKHITKLFALLLIVFSMACSNDDDDMKVVYAGSWAGTFAGDDSGTFEVTISENGKVTGDAFSNNLQQNLPLNGQIDSSGDLRAVLGSAENGASFTGKFSNTSASGTWNNPSFQGSGTWSGTKQ